MKGIVLAGGLGSRMYPLTKVTNKHLLPIYHKPMIYYPIETLVGAGIREILIVTGGKNAGDFLRLLGNGKEFGLNHINYTYQEGEGGIAAALSLAEFFADQAGLRHPGRQHHRRVDRPLCGEFQKQGAGSRILLKECRDPQRFGVAKIEGNRIVRIDEKPAGAGLEIRGHGDLHVRWRGLRYREGVEAFRAGRARDHRRKQLLHPEGEMQYDILDGWWTDAGTFESLLRASNLVGQNAAKKQTTS